MATNECDTNADTCCLGRNFVVLHATYWTADVYAYDTSMKPIENVPIVSGATAYDDPITGTTYILVFNESLYYGELLDHSTFGSEFIAMKIAVELIERLWYKLRMMGVPIKDPCNVFL